MDRLGDGPKVVVAGCPAQVVAWGRDGSMRSL